MNLFEFSLQNILIYSAFVILLILVAKYKIKEIRKKRLQKKRFARGSLLETQARKYLVSLGYNIVHEQYSCYHKYKVNGVENVSKLILDYVVSKNGKQYIVEVKSGKYAISVSNKNSRRQLLEYDFAIENDGVFLLDMENKNMQLVEFYSKGKSKSTDYILVFIMVIATIGIFIPNIEIKAFVVFIMVAIWAYRKLNN